LNQSCQAASEQPVITPFSGELEPRVERLISVFNSLFAGQLNTQLVAGDDEPLYLPACGELPCRVIFAHGFFASALHEISHWLVAGPERRQLEDFGYWYKPDGRSAQEQEEFERVEVKPQALEMILSKASGHQFHFSADNLSSGIGASDAFQTAVTAQAKSYLEQGLPTRAALLVNALCMAFKQPRPVID